jgi:hypothetical protein
MADLLRKAAELFEDGRDPFETNFLSDNNVTLDECMSLSEAIGLILKGFLRADKDTQNIVVVNGALSGTEVPAEMIDASVRMPSLIKRLQNAKVK